MRNHPGVPFPLYIQLRVSYAGLNDAQQQEVLHQLSTLNDWRSAEYDDERMLSLMRYRYAPNRVEPLVRAAKNILRRAGIREPQVSWIVVWRVDFTLQSSPPEQLQLDMAMIKKLPGVLEVNGWPFTVEFRGKPNEDTIDAIRRRLRPYGVPQ